MSSSTSDSDYATGDASSSDESETFESMEIMALYKDTKSTLKEAGLGDNFSVEEFVQMVNKCSSSATLEYEVTATGRPSVFWVE